MSLERDARFLRAIDIFTDFSLDELKLLAFNAVRRNIDKGRNLFSEGERATGAIVIVSGQARLIRTGADGEDMDEGVYGPGTMFGGLSLIVESSRPARAQALTDVEMIMISRGLFHRLLKEYPERAVVLYKRLSTELRVTVEEITSLYLLPENAV